MKTPEEIKKGLECCVSCTACSDCPYDRCGDEYGRCTPVLISDVFDYTHQLEAKDVKQSQRIAELEKELAAVMRERDAAVGTLLFSGVCVGCIHDSFPVPCKHRLYCKRNSPNNPDGKVDKWQWRGVTSKKEVSPDA